MSDTETEGRLDALAKALSEDDDADEHRIKDAAGGILRCVSVFVSKALRKILVRAHCPFIRENNEVSLLLSLAGRSRPHAVKAKHAEKYFIEPYSGIRYKCDPAMYWSYSNKIS